jgi:tRNA-2-methylthio-N6-dimethylallyladenosine synthase
MLGVGVLVGNGGLEGCEVAEGTAVGDGSLGVWPSGDEEPEQAASSSAARRTTVFFARIIFGVFPGGLGGRRDCRFGIKLAICPGVMQLFKTLREDALNDTRFSEVGRSACYVENDVEIWGGIIDLMKYHLWTAGCQMNVADSLRVATALEKLEYRPTDDADQADVIVLNTCVVRQSAEDKAYGRLTSLRGLKKRRPEVVINLMGCLVGIKGNPGLREAFPHVDVFSPPSDPTPLVAFLTASEGKSATQSEVETRNAILDGELGLPLNERGRLVSAFVPVVYGCSHACTFCVIPYRRGAESSRPMDEIVHEMRILADQGVREVTLLGQIVDRYGLDLDASVTLVNLLERVHEVEGIERIRFLTSHPNWMTDDLLDAVAGLRKVCEHIEVPVQAGDDEVLARMKRGYTSDDYRRLVARIRERVPGVSIATDVIVGFPGETRAQFQRTYDLLAELKLDVAHLARFSPRPQTVAARRMQDDVPDDEKMDRFRVLEELQAGIVTEINRTNMGKTVEVLVEEQQRGRWKGRTRNNKLVFFEGEGAYRGKLVPVNVEWTGPWSMIGIPEDSPVQRDASPETIASS